MQISVESFGMLTFINQTDIINLGKFYNHVTKTNCNLFAHLTRENYLMVTRIRVLF